MFTTHHPFKLPIQFDKESTIWRAVELELSTPWFVATVLDGEEGISRTFLLTGSPELHTMLNGHQFGTLQSLQLVMTPNWSSDHRWHFIPIRRIELRLRPADGASPDAVVQAEDGVRYGGFPIERLTGDIGPVETLAELEE